MELQNGCASLGLQLGDMQIKTLENYLVLLDKWNRSFNLTSITDKDKMITHHLLDSLSVVKLIQGPNVADVGTGAGLPGIPLAIALPQWQFTLIDANSKKTRFLTQSKIELGIRNVDVIHSTIEEFPKQGNFDTVVTRAFAAVKEIYEKSHSMVKPGGQILAMKGRQPREEAALLPQGVDYNLQQLEVPGLLAERHVVKIRIQQP